MRVKCIMCLFCLLVFLSGCKEYTPIPSSSHSSQSDNSASSVYTPESDDEVYLRTCIRRYSSCIIEGTVCNKETIQPYEHPLYANTEVWDVYTFSDIDVITGQYNESTCIINVLHDGLYKEDMDFEVGGRYIVLVNSNDSVFTPPDKIIQQSPRVRCKLNDEDHEKIEELTINGNKTGIIHSRHALIQIVEEEVGLGNEYYKKEDQYIHSSNIPEIVEHSPVVIRVKIMDIQMAEPDSWAGYFTGELKRKYKGNLSAEIGDLVLLRLHPGSADVGCEYLVMCAKQGTITMGDQTTPMYAVVSKMNSVVDITDTDRVKQVYDALGIQSAP